MPRRSIEIYILSALIKEWEEMADALPNNTINRAKKTAVGSCAKSLRRVIKGWHDAEESEYQL